MSSCYDFLSTVNGNEGWYADPQYASIQHLHLIFLLVEQPVNVVVLVSLLGHHYVFGADDVEEGLSLGMLWCAHTGTFNPN